jgi:antitoxin YefM
MQVISYSKLRENLKDFISQACEEREPIIVTRTKGPPAILISLEDYNTFNETTKILSNPQQVAWLRQSLESANKGDIISKSLIDPDV